MVAPIIALLLVKVALFIISELLILKYIISELV
jgi:hypothetical protein